MHKFVQTNTFVQFLLCFSVFVLGGSNGSLARKAMLIGVSLFGERLMHEAITVRSYGGK